MEYRPRSDQASDRNQSKSVRKALTVLDALATGARGMTSAEIGQITGIPAATVSRLLRVLVEMKYVKWDPGMARYSLGWRIVQLSSAMLNSVELRAKAKLHLLRLMQQLQETVNLGILHDGQVLYVDRVDSLNTPRLYAAVGKTLSAHCASMGKAILAFSPESVVREVLRERGLPAQTKYTITDPQQFLEHLEEIRRAGIAVDNQEHQEGIKCVAAPIFGHSGVVGAVSVSAPATCLVGALLEKAASYVRAAAREISEEMGGASYYGV